MYSKKINQLATNLNPQETDLLPIGDAETGQLKTTTFGSVSGITGDGVISGGIVTWTGTGLIFNISACTYILNGIRYSSPFSTKTLAAADPTNARIDVFAVNTSGQVEVIQGTPASNPVEPEGDTATTLGLTNVTINAGATTPNGVTRDLIYDENVESWTKTFTQSASSVDYANTLFPNTGSKCILVTQGAGFVLLNFTNATTLDVSNFKSLSFAIRLTNAFTSNTILAVRFYNGANTSSNLFQLSATNNVGFNRNLAGVYQIITIPFNNTNLKFTNNSFTTIRIQTSNAAATYRLDTIQLNGGVNNPTGGGTTPSNSFGFVNATTGTASSTTATDTLNVVGSGLITTSATGKTLTIASNQIATSSILGRVTASTGNIETLTGTQATTLLDVFTSSLKGLAPASGGGTTNFLRADGTWAAAGAGMAIGGSISSATAGSVLFAGTSGVLQQDNANFFWDDTNNRLGIGTTSPAYKLDVSGSAYSSLGLITQGYTLAASGFNIEMGIISGYAQINSYNRTTSAFGSLRLDGSNIMLNSGSGGNVLIGTTTDAGFKLYVNGTTRLNGSTTFGTIGSGTGMFWDNTNNRLGIGTNTPTYDIHLLKNQNAITRQIIENTTIGTASRVVYQLLSDVSAGNVQFGKTSSTFTPNKIINSSDAYINNVTAGDISILNDFATGKIKFAGGGASTAQMTLTAAGRLLIGTTTENSSALLNVTSTTQGFLPPRMTTTEKNAIGTPAAGLIVYDTTLNKLCVRTASAWETITSL